MAMVDLEEGYVIMVVVSYICITGVFEVILHNVTLCIMVRVQ